MPSSSSSGTTPVSRASWAGVSADGAAVGSAAGSSVADGSWGSRAERRKRPTPTMRKGIFGRPGMRARTAMIAPVVRTTRR